MAACQVQIIQVIWGGGVGNVNITLKKSSRTTPFSGPNFLFALTSGCMRTRNLTMVTFLLLSLQSQLPNHYWKVHYSH